jgi:hypothetical protein
MNPLRPFILSLLLPVIPSAHGESEESLIAAPSSQLSDYWIPDPEGFREARRMTREERNADAGCLVISFIIESDGTTSSPQLVFGFPDDKLADFFRESLQKGLRFEPAENNPNRNPVFTAQRISAMPDEHPSYERVSEVCEQAETQFWNKLGVDNPVDTEGVEPDRD